VLVSLYSLEAVAFGVLGWLAHRFSLAPVLVVAFLDGVLAVTARALARATTVAVLTPAGLLREGNAVTNASFSICLTAGPAIGGVIVATGGTAAALFANCGLFAAISVELATASLPPAPAERAPTAGRLRAALDHARKNVQIRNLLSVQAAGLVFFTMSVPVLVVLVQHTLHGDASAYGGVLSAWGGGAVVGSIAFAAWRRRPMRILIAASAVFVGLGYLVLAGAPTLAIAIVGAIFGGVGNGLEQTSARTALQEVVDEGWMGMMMSLSESVDQATPGVGILLGGAITALASPRTAFAVAGVGALVIAPVALIALRPSSGERLRRGQVA
jgi:predicted MFS family arabinose efflux permease